MCWHHSHASAASWQMRKPDGVGGPRVSGERGQGEDHQALARLRTVFVVRDLHRGRVASVPGSAGRSDGKGGAAGGVLEGVEQNEEQ